MPEWLINLSDAAYSCCSRKEAFKWGVAIREICQKDVSGIC